MPPVPEVIDLSTLNLSDPTASIQEDPSLEGDIDGCVSGDGYACSRLISALIVACGDGDGLSCDVLYEVTEPGSD